MLGGETSCLGRPEIEVRLLSNSETFQTEKTAKISSLPFNREPDTIHSDTLHLIISHLGSDVSSAGGPAPNHLLLIV